MNLYYTLSAALLFHWIPLCAISLTGGQHSVMGRQGVQSNQQNTEMIITLAISSSYKSVLIKNLLLLFHKMRFSFAHIYIYFFFNFLVSKRTQCQLYKQCILHLVEEDVWRSLQSKGSGSSKTNVT